MKLPWRKKNKSGLLSDIHEQYFTSWAERQLGASHSKIYQAHDTKVYRWHPCFFFEGKENCLAGTIELNRKWVHKRLVQNPEELVKVIQLQWDSLMQTLEKEKANL